MQPQVRSAPLRGPGVLGTALVLLLAAGAAAQRAVPGAVPPDPTDAAFAPIRFGDPEETGADEAFFPGTPYDAAIPTPDELLGRRHATRLSHHDEILDCFEAWAAASPRVAMERYALSHEGRELVWVAISDPANIARLDAIRAATARLADPRATSDAEAAELAARTPPVAWLGYSIHGDELSGSDAALAVGHHLIAGTSDEVAELLRRVVVVIDPVMNPDGRERIIGMVEQAAGHTPSLDYASMHRGRWPWGRGNHYLFDMNRDWMAGVHPETRGRWRAARSWQPVLFVDAHEMGPLDTFLFYPQAAPNNPHLPPTLGKWHADFAAAMAREFDRHGWGYYTREWADGWAPIYSDAWASLNGFVGILYEQASTAGAPLMRASGDVLTYREAVRHHASASLACLRTVAASGPDLLTDLRRHRSGFREPGAADRMFVFRPGRNRDREEALLAILLGQGLEVWRAAAGTELTAATDAVGATHARWTAPAGTLAVPLAQPGAARVATWLGFDARIDAASLLEEREELERRGESKIYDVTAWSLPLAFDADAAWCDAIDPAAAGWERVAAPGLPGPARGAVLDAADAPGDRPVAWAVDGADDASVRFAAQALQLGLAVHLADEPFRTAGHAFPRGSLLVRRHENGDEVEARIARAAAASGATVHATHTARSPDEGPDLGGQHFALLARPRVAVVANMPVWPDDFGHVWWLLDHELGIPTSQLDAQTLGGADLRRYNVIVVPDGDVDGLLAEHAEALRDWVRQGGTLIAFGGAAAAVADEELGLSEVRRRRDRLDELASWERDVDREIGARVVDVDVEVLWGGPGAVAGDAAAAGPAGDGDGAPSDADGQADDAAGADDAMEDGADQGDGVQGEDARRLDAWRRRFAPRGAYLRALVDVEHWLAAGCRDVLPVHVDGGHALLSRTPVETPVRLADAGALRLSGLLWPEAAARLGHAAYLTREALGDGQVVLFAASPAFRGYNRGTARLLANAIVYGPGVGARQPLGW